MPIRTILQASDERLIASLMLASGAALAAPRCAWRCRCGARVWGLKSNSSKPPSSDRPEVRSRPAAAAKSAYPAAADILGKPFARSTIPTAPSITCLQNSQTAPAPDYPAAITACVRSLIFPSRNRCGDRAPRWPLHYERRISRRSGSLAIAPPFSSCHWMRRLATMIDAQRERSADATIETMKPPCVPAQCVS